jgi:positive regulator of sigma E activity
MTVDVDTIVVEVMVGLVTAILQALDSAADWYLVKPAGVLVAALLASVVVEKTVLITVGVVVVKAVALTTGTIHPRYVEQKGCSEDHLISARA